MLMNVTVSTFGSYFEIVNVIRQAVESMAHHQPELDTSIWVPPKKLHNFNYNWTNCNSVITYYALRTRICLACPNRIGLPKPTCNWAMWKDETIPNTSILPSEILFWIEYISSLLLNAVKLIDMNEIQLNGVSRSCNFPINYHKVYIQHPRNQCWGEQSIAIQVIGWAAHPNKDQFCSPDLHNLAAPIVGYQNTDTATKLI